MIKLEDLRLSDIMPERESPPWPPEVMAMLAAIDPELQEITAAIDEALIMTRIDELPETIVDLLAWQLHVDFYEPLGLDLNKKRALVKNSLMWHKHKGTKYVLEEMIRTLFFENFSVEEWFEYGGEPFFFRVTSRDILANKEQYDDLIRAIFELKNERSWLESLRFFREAQGTIHIGQVGKHTGRFKVDADAPQTKTPPATLYLGSVGKYMRRFEISGTLPEYTKVSPVATFVGIAGKQTRRFEISATDVIVEVEDTILNLGLSGKKTRNFTIPAAEVAMNTNDPITNSEMENRHIPKSYIGSPEEVKN